jgi:hypothetical protein
MGKFTIKPIELNEGRTLTGLPKLSTNLPFGYFVVIRPYFEIEEQTGYFWYIEQRTTRIIQGLCDTIDEAVDNCQKAWYDIVKQALKEVR